MTGAGRFILIGCLLQGALCSTWSARMPQNIQALHGSCVLIPCTFQIPSNWSKNLKDPVGMWWSNRSSNGKIIYFSNKTANDIQGNIIGDLLKKNCTTVLNNILSRWTGNFSFRIEGIGDLKYNFDAKVKIYVKDSPPSPQITINRDMVKEGGSVNLTCSAPAPCPSLPPSLSWTLKLSDNITVFQKNDDHTKHVSSVMNFTASHLHHKQEVKCTAVYRLQANNNERTSYTNVTLNVQYSPKNTLVLKGKDRNLICSSDANPAVNNYTWYKVTGSEIKVVSHRQNLTCNITEVSGQYYCQARNEHGLQNSSTVQLDSEYSSPSPQITINRDMVKEGGSVTLREGDSVILREGDSVNLTCSVPAPCPSLPPTLSWTPRLSDSITVFQENDDHTKHVSSVMNFTASHLHHKQEVKCTAVYRLQADNSERTSHTNVTLNVQYSPKNTLVLIGKDRNLTCSSDANPAVNNYTWYKVTGSETKVVSHRQNLTCNITEVSGQYYCQAQNEHGLQNSSTVQLDSESVKAPPTLIGAAAGAAGMILTCILLTITLKKSCSRQNHGSMTQETGELTPTNQGTGTIRGSSQSTEYAEVKLNTRKEQGGTEEKSEAQQEQEQHVSVLGIDPEPNDKRKESQEPGSGDVSGCGFRTPESTETQKRKTEIGVKQENVEDRKSSGLDDLLYTPEPKEEATYANICRQLGTEGPDKRSATVGASGNKRQRGGDQQDDYVIASEEKGTNESEYAVVKKDKIVQ
ncbi:B-cell receptor CD22-like isoform X2 [Brienomyrus brachyistius]|uniref:B-cell receptor CD22-like isoform X2 n=1 Tax=Brienomyrus brachyistius TaxID=42636 RepID=UPI0020B19B30|nr:B-cell receptor CD22-like isoform X2 [Brienomyrus brachyistius]